MYTRALPLTPQWQFPKSAAIANAPIALLICMHAPVSSDPVHQTCCMILEKLNNLYSPAPL